MTTVKLLIFNFLLSIVNCATISSRVTSVSVGNFWSITQYTANSKRYIEDGGNDMYDNGNCITVPGTSSNSCSGDSVTVLYKDNCESGTVNGETYTMSIKADGISVLWFKNYTKSSISINGDNGADGGGSVSAGSYSYKGWKGFWKVVWNSSRDPGINHLWVTNAPSPSHSYASSTNYDYDELKSINGYSVVYLLWGTSPNTRTSDSQMQKVVEAVVG